MRTRSYRMSGNASPLVELLSARPRLRLLYPVPAPPVWQLAPSQQQHLLPPLSEPPAALPTAAGGVPIVVPPVADPPAGQGLLPDIPNVFARLTRCGSSISDELDQNALPNQPGGP